MPREQSWVADSGIHEWIANNKYMKTRTNHCLNMNALHNPSLTALPMPMNTPACEVWKAEFAKSSSLYELVDQQVKVPP